MLIGHSIGSDGRSPPVKPLSRALGLATARRFRWESLGEEIGFLGLVKLGTSGALVAGRVGVRCVQE